MTETAELIRDLMAVGADADLIARVVRLSEASRDNLSPAERKREYDRGYNAGRRSAAKEASNISQPSMFSPDPQESLRVVRVVNSTTFDDSKKCPQTPINTSSLCSEVKEHDGGGDAREPLISDEAVALADEVAAIAGLDPTDPLATPPGWCGAALKVQSWLNGGWHPDVIRAGTRAAMARKRDGPPDTATYFEKPIARLHAQQGQPLPIAEHRQGHDPPNGYAPRRGSRDDIRERNIHALDQLREFAARGAHDESPGRGDARPVLALVSKSQRD